MNDSSKCEDIRLACSIRNILSLQSLNAYHPPDNNPGPSVSGPSGGRGSHGSKRKGTGSSSSSEKGKKKVRKVSGGGDGTGDCGKPRKAGGELITTFRLPLRPSRNIDIPPKAWSQNGQSHDREIISLSRSMEYEAPVELIDAGWNDSDSESGRSECIFERSSHFDNGCKGVSAMSPHDKDNPNTWRFGPLFSTNKIVSTARAVNLPLYIIRSFHIMAVLLGSIKHL